MPQISLGEEQDRILERKAGREHAEACFQLIDPDGRTAAWLESCYENLDRMIRQASRLKARESERQQANLTPCQNAAFGRSEWPFGKHKGQPVDSIPLDYLDWWLGESELLHRRVAAYLKQRRYEAKESDLSDRDQE